MNIHPNEGISSEIFMIYSRNGYFSSKRIVYLETQ